MRASPSTEHPEALPDLAGLLRLTKSIALLDAIICPDWQYRYYSFNSKWGSGEEMASMRDGCGDDWFLLFDSAGAALKGFAHESPQAGDNTFPARIQTLVPATFASFLREPAFKMEAATFCLWRSSDEKRWTVVFPSTGRISAEADGSNELLAILDGQPETYRDWAQDYYEKPIALNAVQSIYGHQPLTGQIIAALNDSLSLPEVVVDVTEIGYPML